jgi:RNA polymerase sigma-70 factor (ECF subfamily)
MSPEGPRPGDEREVDRHLSQITTLWTLVFRAHQAPREAARAAQLALWQRYGSAVCRYLFRVLGDPAAVAELSQEFALRLVRGDFQRVDPQRGRFRDYVKTVVLHLLVDYRRQRQAQPGPLPADSAVLTAAPAGAADDQEFLEQWRQELLERAWEALAELQRQTGQPFHTVLRLRVEQPGLRSAQLAEQAAAHLGRAFTVAALRQALHRAREKFADLLLEEVERSLETSEPGPLEQEVLDLGLLPYCRSALARRRG